MARVPGTGAISVGLFLFVVGILFVVLVPECSVLFGCPLALPAIFYTFSAALLGFLIILVGVMLIATGAIVRARARLPRRIV